MMSPELTPDSSPRAHAEVAAVECAQAAARAAGWTWREYLQVLGSFLRMHLKRIP